MQWSSRSHGAVARPLDATRVNYRVRHMNPLLDRRDCSACGPTRTILSSDIASGARGSKAMGLIVVLIILIILFGGGGFYLGPPFHYFGGGLGLLLVIVLLVLLFRR
jgi:hypothetical protein